MRDRRIRVLARLVDLLLLALVVGSFLVSIWAGFVAAVVWVVVKDVAPSAALTPFFGAERVREALWGDLILRPPLDQRAPPLGEDLVGRSAQVSTELGPEGFVTIGGHRYPARSDGSLVPIRTRVVVRGVHLGSALLVTPSDAAPAPPSATTP